MKKIYWIFVLIIYSCLVLKHNIEALLAFYIVFFPSLILFLILWGLFADTKRKRKDKLTARVSEIKKKYPKAFKDFTSHIGNHIFDDNPSIESLKKVASRKDDIWEKEEKQLIEEEEKWLREWEKKYNELEKKVDKIKEKYPKGFEKWEETHDDKYWFDLDLDIVEFEEKIAALDKHIKTEKWEKAQSEYASQCYSLAKQFLDGCGRFIYNIPFKKYDLYGNKKTGTYKVWQFFRTAMCLEDLDYTYFPSTKKAASLMPALKNKSKWYKTFVYTNIVQFIKEVANYYCKSPNENISVILNYNKDWDENVLDFHYKALVEIICSDDNYKHINWYKSTDLLDYDENREKRILLSDDRIIIVDIVTNNEELKKLCENIINYDENAHPVISYISLLKEFDKGEMISLINKENQRQAKLKEEREKEEKAKKKLVDGVSSWDLLAGVFRYSYLFYYYPTNCDFEATEEEWNARWFVWNFKNDPDQTSNFEHQQALDNAIPMLKKKILKTFDTDSLKYLTLVCIPASSQIKTQARYEEFSKRICDELGMINAYPYIKVVSEKAAKHLGGAGIDLKNLSFDEDFFKGRYVLLFDDVITKGDSMLKFKHKMESLGAFVVGGLSLGKTKHERPLLF